jgi:hypothetical protein
MHVLKTERLAKQVNSFKRDVLNEYTVECQRHCWPWLKAKLKTRAGILIFAALAVVVGLALLVISAPLPAKFTIRRHLRIAAGLCCCSVSR